MAFCVKDCDSVSLSVTLSVSAGFSKVRIMLRTLSIVPDDLTFSSATNHARYGDGRLCAADSNRSTCVGADANIDLRGTAFKIKVINIH